MKNNRVLLIKKTEGDSYTVRARNRLIREYNKHRNNGGWRSVRDKFKVKNVATVYNFAMHGTEPKNLEERIKLGLKNICPTCERPIRKSSAKKARKPVPEFMKVWRKLPTQKRNEIIIDALRKHGIG